MKKLRVGVIGSGFGARVHVPAFAGLSSCEIVAQAGSAGWRRLVSDDKIDLVTAAVPPGAQPAILAACARRKKAVFFEKPLCAEWRQARALARSMGRVPSAVDFEFAELGSWLEMKRLLDRKELGRLSHAAIDWHLETYAIKHRLYNWRSQKKRGGGALGAFGSHVLYHLEWLFGPANEVTASLWRLSGLRGDAETAFSAVFRMKAGFLAFVDVTTHAPNGEGHRVQAWGEKGALRLENRGEDHIRGFELWRARRQTGWQKLAVRETDFDHTDSRVPAVRSLAARLIDGARKGKRVVPGFREALRVQWLMECIRRSSSEKKWVDCR